MPSGLQGRAGMPEAVPVAGTVGSLVVPVVDIADNLEVVPAAGTADSLGVDLVGVDIAVPEVGLADSLGAVLVGVGIVVPAVDTVGSLVALVVDIVVRVVPAPLGRRSGPSVRRLRR